MQSILKTVETHNFRSIAIPALSSGIFNFPLKACCETITRTIKDFYEKAKSRDTPLTINLVNNDQKTVTAMERACVRILSKGDMTASSASVRNPLKSLHERECESTEQQV